MTSASRRPRYAIAVCDDLSVLRQMVSPTAIAAVLLFAAACSAGNDGTPTGEAPATSERTTAPPTAPPATSAPDELDVDGADGETLDSDLADPAPFEREPVSPAEPGADLDDVLREQRSTTTVAPTSTISTNPGDASPADDDQPAPTVAPPPRVATLEPGPLGWTLRAPVDPTSNRIDLLVDEGDCDGALPVDQRLDVTAVVESDRVVIGVSRRNAAGPDRTPCPTAPLSPVSIGLDQPVGERSIIDRETRGSTAADQGIGDVDAQLTLLTTASGPPMNETAVVEVTDAAFSVTVECEAVGGRPSDWRPAVEFATPELAAITGAGALGQQDTPWHRYLVDAGDDRGVGHTWVATNRGTPVVVIDARPGALGWVGSGTGCRRDDGASIAVDATAPDTILSAAPVPIETAPLLDIAAMIEWVGVPASMESTGGGLRFADRSRRCDGWRAIEDGLLAAGFVLGSERSTIDPASVLDAAPGVATAAQRQVERRVTAPDGRAAILSTSAAGELVVRRVAARETVAVSSRLRTCRLDGDVGVIPVVVS